MRFAEVRARERGWLVWARAAGATFGGYLAAGQGCVGGQERPEPASGREKT